MISKTTFAEIFGEDAEVFLEVFEIAVPKLNGLTIDWAEKEFHELLTQDHHEAQKQYWLELLGRAYIAAAGTVVPPNGSGLMKLLCIRESCLPTVCGLTSGATRIYG